jgi:hypothetical protein
MQHKVSELNKTSEFTTDSENNLKRLKTMLNATKTATEQNFRIQFTVAFVQLNCFHATNRMQQNALILGKICG